MIGQTFGKLTVIAEANRNRHGQRRVRVRCECGTEREVYPFDLKSGHTKSCGCLRGMDHGGLAQEYPAEYSAWKAMIDRCMNPQSSIYGYYGDRGISVCNQWRESFATFLSDVGPRPSSELSLDRSDVDGNYEPGNVRWAARSEQQRNRRDNRWLDHAGERRLLIEWASLLWISPQTIRDRLKRGWTIERALNTPTL